MPIGWQQRIESLNNYIFFAKEHYSVFRKRALLFSNEWQQRVGSYNCQVSFAKEPYFDLLGPFFQSPFLKKSHVLLIGWQQRV